MTMGSDFEVWGATAQFLAHPFIHFHRNQQPIMPMMPPLSATEQQQQRRPFI